MSVTSPKPEHPDPGYSQADWDEVSDTPDLTDAQLADLRPVQEVPEVSDRLPRPGRGRPRLADAKVNLTLRVDPAVLDAYKATGAGWQVRMQEALLAGLGPKPLTASGSADATALAAAVLSRGRQGARDPGGTDAVAAVRHRTPRRPKPRTV